MKSLLIVLLSLATTQAFAGGAIAYDCVGVNRADRTAIDYNIYFEDYVSEVGYTNQAITITKIGATELREGITLQMFRATKENDCQSAGLNSTYFNPGKDGYEMSVPNKDDGIAYINRVKSNCENAKYDIIGICQPQ